jgi:uncharacterized protein YegP (UPF0339 family)
MPRRLHVYRDKKHEWRWTVFAANGKKLANSGEGYKRYAACARIARSLMPQFVLAKL